MAVYRYEALDERGNRRRGQIDADSARAARARLRAQGLAPIGVTEAGAADGTAAGQRRALNRTRLASWTRQLASLVAGGLPLERALATLADEAETPRERELVTQLRAEVNAGSALATALAAHPRTFDDSYRAVVAAGEASGRLGAVLERLADELEASDALRQRVLSAVLYPTIVTVFALAIVVFLMTSVVPQVAQAFSSGRRALPLLTVVMLRISQWLRDWGWTLPVLAALGAGAIAGARHTPALRQRLDRAWLGVPVVGRLSRQYDVARFAGTLALLTGAGVPLLRALQTAAGTLRNHALRADALEVLALVREGAPLAAALATRRAFAGPLIAFARLGEQTGQLSAMLQRAAQQLAADVQRRTLRLATLLEPALIIAMGAIVLLIVLSVMLPIIQLNQLVR
ncbi:MAG: type II secretion system inner membrane protein GspF [Tepidimonas taiwanensis]|uniref:type II secretion system inner membrane protein GspF n=1 Tax=Tepidimonas taiwanensis TaxID=307486 RepID=UPI0005BE739C|nr:type II secretion system inner membrane protein GspF [Tepidimonas taiwanensis]MCX7693050.1 type II secretion system inner membrane protein GspF [Tepidimonas taiwanensis]